MRMMMHDTFFFFRAVWSRRASYHLARVRWGIDWRDRLISARWLILNHIPYTGVAQSMDFHGLGD